jgi:serine/threonine-protein kinase
LHAASLLPPLAQWLLCRTGARTVGCSVAVELVCTALVCAMVVSTGVFMPLLVMPALLVAFIVGSVLNLRAIFVPSPPLRTLAIGLAVGVPYVLLAIHVSGRWHPELDVRARTAFGADAADLPFLPIAIGWWLLNLAVSTSASHVIYGLRERVREVQRLGQYELEEKLGEGGMGVIYRARHALLQRPTAVKLLHEEVVGETSLRRFEQEVRLTARLSHPNTITIYDYGRTPEGTFYYAMELLEGATLEVIVKKTGALSAARVIHILRQVAGSLAEAHAIGLVHRDIKPDNVMLCQQGGAADLVKVLDFGLVKQVEAGGDAKLTGTNVVVGTPQYMAPEAIRAVDRVDARADLYSLAATAYYLLTARDVFEGESVVEICGHHLHSDPVPPSRLTPGIPADLEAIVMRCLAKRPEDRPDDARALGALLAACDATDWTERDAASWWDAHGPALSRAAGARSIPAERAASPTGPARAVTA